MIVPGSILVFSWGHVKEKKLMKTERICHNADAFAKPKMKIDKPKKPKVIVFSHP